MPIDASIPLASQNQVQYGLNSLVQLAQMQRQNKMDQQAMQARNALLSIYQDPKSLDASGMPTPEAIRQISAIDPSQGMKLRTDVSKVEAQNALGDQRKAQAYKERGQAVNDATEPALIAYDNVISKGGSREQAQIAAQNLYNEGVERLKKSGLLSDQEAQSIPSNFDENRIRGGSLKYKDWLAAQSKDRTQDMAETRLQSQLKHQEAMERISEARLGLAERASERAASNAAGDPNAKLDAETAGVMADQYLAGDNSVFTNLGRGKQGAENVLMVRKAIADKMKTQGMSGADVAGRMAEFQGVKAGQRALGTRTANVEMAVNEASQMADLALEASNKVPRTGFVPVNKAILAYNDNTGDPATRQFGAANNSFINAYARAVSPTGTPTVSDKEHAREMLSRADSQQAYTAIISQLKKEMEAAKKSPGMVRQEFREAVSPGKAESSSDYSHLWK